MNKNIAVGHVDDMSCGSGLCMSMGALFPNLGYSKSRDKDNRGG